MSAISATAALLGPAVPATAAATPTLSATPATCAPSADPTAPAPPATPFAAYLGQIRELARPATGTGPVDASPTARPTAAGANLILALPPRAAGAPLPADPSAAAMTARGSAPSLSIPAALATTAAPIATSPAPIATSTAPAALGATIATTTTPATDAAPTTATAATPAPADDLESRVTTPDLRRLMRMLTQPTTTIDTSAPAAAAPTGSPLGAKASRPLGRTPSPLGADNAITPAMLSALTALIAPTPTAPSFAAPTAPLAAGTEVSGLTTADAAPGPTAATASPRGPGAATVDAAPPSAPAPTATASAPDPTPRTPLEQAVHDLIDQMRGADHPRAGHDASLTERPRAAEATGLPATAGAAPAPLTAVEPAARSSAAPAGPAPLREAPAALVSPNHLHLVVGEGDQRVVVTVAVRGAEINVNLRTADDHTAASLARNAASLDDAMRSRGLHLAEMTAEPDRRDPRDARDPSAQRERPRPSAAPGRGDAEPFTLEETP